MSKPYPVIAIDMLRELLNRIENGTITFFIGDFVDVWDNINEECFKATIKYPYCYDVEGEQSYCVNETAVPYKSSELILIKSAENSKANTIEFINQCIEKEKNELYR